MKNKNNSLFAGAAKVCITPPEEWLPMFNKRNFLGGGPDSYFGAVLDDIFVKSLVIENGYERIVMVVFDLIALPYPVHDELPALSPKKYNITFLKLSVRLFEIYHIPCMDQKRCHTASKDQHADFLSLFRQFLKHTNIFSCIYNFHIPHPASLYPHFVRSVFSQIMVQFSAHPSHCFLCIH